MYEFFDQVITTSNGHKLLVDFCYDAGYNYYKDEEYEYIEIYYVNCACADSTHCSHLDEHEIKQLEEIGREYTQNQHC